MEPGRLPHIPPVGRRTGHSDRYLSVGTVTHTACVLPLFLSSAFVFVAAPTFHILAAPPIVVHSGPDLPTRTRPDCLLRNRPGIAVLPKGGRSQSSGS